MCIARPGAEQRTRLAAPPSSVVVGELAYAARAKPLCGGIAPIQRSIPFADIRRMEPEAFVALLALELQVKGVVVGANFRFGALLAAVASAGRPECVHEGDCAAHHYRAPTVEEASHQAMIAKQRAAKGARIMMHVQQLLLCI